MSLRPRTARLWAPAGSLPSPATSLPPCGTLDPPSPTLRPVIMGSPCSMALRGTSETTAMYLAASPPPSPSQLPPLPSGPPPPEARSTLPPPNMPAGTVAAGPGAWRYSSLPPLPCAPTGAKAPSRAGVPPVLLCRMLVKSGVRFDDADSEGAGRESASLLLSVPALRAAAVAAASKPCASAAGDGDVLAPMLRMPRSPAGSLL